MWIYSTNFTLCLDVGTYEEAEGTIFFHMLQPYQNEKKNLPFL